MFRKKSRSRRRDFLLETKSHTNSSGKRLRNRFLNSFTSLLLLRPIRKLFRASVIGGSVILFMIGFIAFAVFSPYFHIKKIEIVRDNPHLQIVEIQAALEDFYGQNMLFLPQDEIKSTLKKDFPEFRDIKINEQWPATLELAIQVSPPLFTLLNTETANFSVLSEDGVILQNQPDSELPVLKVFQHEKIIPPRTAWIKKEELDRLTQAEALILDLDLTIKERRHYHAAREVHFILSTQVAIWVDLSREIKPQIKKLEWSGDEIGVYTKPLEYIDLRIPEQIFWK